MAPATTKAAARPHRGKAASELSADEHAHAAGGAGTIAEAERAAGAGDWRGAAEHLIAAWHAVRAPQIADVVAALDRRASPAPVEGKTQRARELAWLRLDAARDPADLPSLLATPWPPQPGAAQDRLRGLVARNASPRISHALIAVIERGLYTSRWGQRLSCLIARNLLAQGDPAITRYFAAEEARGATGLEATFKSLLRRRRPAMPRLPPADTTALARIAALAAPAAGVATAATRADLVAAVHAAPFDDGPREVLADALALAGDPRGELIALQLADHRGSGTEKTRARARALLRAAGTQWHAGLDEDARDIGFARGFPATAVVHGATTFTAPGWATIEAIALDIDLPTFRGSPNLRALRRISGLPPDLVATLALPNPALLDDLAVTGNPAPLARAGDTFAPTRLGFGDTTDGALRLAAQSLARWPIARRVTALHLGVGALDNLALAYRLLADAPQLATVELAGLDVPHWEPPRWTAICARDTLRLAWVGSATGGMTGEITDLAPLRAFAPPAGVRTLVASVPKAAQRTDVLARLGDHAAGWGAALVVELREAK